MVYCSTCILPSLHLCSFCGPWYCHPYIILHFWKMFHVLVNTGVVNRCCLFMLMCHALPAVPSGVVADMVNALGAPPG